MPTVVLSPIGNDAPFVDSSGDPLSGGLLYFYDAGTTTPQATYTTIAGSVTNANPVVLNANGYPASGGSVVSIWMIDGEDYKVELKNSAGTTVWTRDNISGVNDSGVSVGAATQAQMEAGTSVVTYVTPGRAQYHQSAAKAWCEARYDGGGFFGSYNCASISDTGTGTIGINWTTAFSSANYVVVTTIEAGGTALLMTIQISTVSLCNSLVQTPAGVATDPTSSHWAAFGDQ